MRASQTGERREAAAGTEAARESLREAAAMAAHLQQEAVTALELHNQREVPELLSTLTRPA